MKLPQDFRELLAELALEKVEYVVIGGYAFAFHAEPEVRDPLESRAPRR